MRIIECEQGSAEWIAARIGRPTASNFDRLITKSGKPSAGADRYLARLAAEWFLGESLDDYASQFMERGSALEKQAIKAYEFETDQDTTPVGLCLRDDGKVGASPDRLVGTDGALEIKCPSAEVHMTYILDGPPDEYKPQTQGQLWITGRQWVDLLCYHPTLPHVRVRATRDEEYIAALAGIVDAFLVRLDAAKERLAPDKAERDRRLREAEDDAQAAVGAIHTGGENRHMPGAVYGRYEQ